MTCDDNYRVGFLTAAVAMMGALLLLGGIVLLQMRGEITGLADVLEQINDAGGDK